MKRFVLIALAFAAVSLSAGELPKFIPLDAEAKPIKDLRDSTSAPDLGYAGALLEEWCGAHGVAEWFYVSNRVETARLFRGAGVHLVRPWNANRRWELGMAWAKTKDRSVMRKRYDKEVLVDPRAYFTFWKENGVRAILCLENRSALIDAENGVITNEIGAVKKSICDYVRWIVDNGFKEVVAGFELGNEPYWGRDSEEYAARWCEIIPEMKRIWPEARIGIPLAEYRAGDPDIAAVRARSTRVDEWFKGPWAEFGFQKLNQWSGRFIVAMSNQLHNVSHVIYHFYGGNSAYGCGASGFKRIRNFARVFPEIKDKKVWITEFRERSDEDLRCQQTFSSTLWKGHYLLAVLGTPEVEGVSLHNLGTLAGGISVSAGGRWVVQRDPQGRDYIDIDDPGHPRGEVGPAGPVFKLYCEALKTHPIILEHGLGHHHDQGSFWGSAMYYDSASAQANAIAKGVPEGKLPKSKTLVEWVAALSSEKDSLVLMMVNSYDRAMKLELSLAGRKFAGEQRIRSVTIPEEHVYSHLIPGERPLWTEGEATGPSVEGDAMTVEIGPRTVQTVTIPLGK